MSDRTDQIGVQVDVLANELLLGGKVGETVSLHAAIAAYVQRRWWGDALCWWLSHTVQPDHCARVRAGLPMTRSARVSAAAQFFLLFCLLHWVAVMLWHLVMTLA